MMEHHIFLISISPLVAPLYKYYSVQHSASTTFKMAATKRKIILCIGDIHGQLNKFHSLWSTVTSVLSRSNTSSTSHVSAIFLGDYCDRGTYTSETINYLLSLPEKYEDITFKFLGGNHDHAFLKFLDTEKDYSPTASNFVSHKPEIIYSGPAHNKMHLQGRRWAGVVDGWDDSIYQARATFQSYDSSFPNRDQLLANIPSSHLQFLKSMDYVYDSESDDLGRVVAVHAGLEEGSDGDIEAQIDKLKSRNDEEPWIEQICGRGNVMNMPESLQAKRFWLVSGHHGVFAISGRRLVVDECSGNEENRMSAIMLMPSDLAKEFEGQVDGDSVSWCPSVDSSVSLIRFRSSN